MDKIAHFNKGDIAKLFPIANPDLIERQRFLQLQPDAAHDEKISSSIHRKQLFKKQKVTNMLMLVVASM